MIKANAKYTAEEILTEAGFKKTEDIFGKMRVRIGGIPGIVSPDYVIKVPTGAKELDIIVGVDTKTLKIKGENKEQVISESAKAKIEEEGREDSKKAEAIAEAKKTE